MGRQARQTFGEVVAMFTTYTQMYRDRISSCVSSYAELVKAAAYHIAHSDDPILAWFVEWEIFVNEAVYKDSPLNTYFIQRAWIDAVQARMRDDATC